jgi:hypothetical protein
MRYPFLPFSPPFLGDEEVNEDIDILRYDWITAGPKVKRFVCEFADFIGALAALVVISVCVYSLKTSKSPFIPRRRATRSTKSLAQLYRSRSGSTV